MNQGRSRRPSSTKFLVLVAIAGAVVFSLYLGYLAWSNDSFPLQEKPFGDYASVTSSTFNGTEYAFHIHWLNGGYVPLYAQLTSAVSDSANTPVCDTGLSSIAGGQTVFMPFTIAPSSAELSSVNLSIAVRSVATGSEFTIVYSVASVAAQPGNIMPSGASCQQPAGGAM
ncbi:MAG: hypothetical protein OK438_02600 [Thaumarchaeota archaeon]|nr:hypothetical protein [Nitrososphaerota archaeon]